MPRTRPAIASQSQPKPASRPPPPAAASAPRVPGHFAILAGRIHTAVGSAIENGVLLIEDGKIMAVGKRADIALPVTSTVITIHEITPGLIDSHTVAALSGA